MTVERGFDADADVVVEGDYQAGSPAASSSACWRPAP